MRWIWSLMAITLLTACAAPGPTRDQSAKAQAYAERAAVLESWEDWSLTGRLGVDDGQEGGSGRLDWTNSPNRSRLQFRGALGQGAWQLEITPDQARLKRSDGSEVVSSGVDELLAMETGWDIPVEALAWWVRGLALPDDDTPDVLELDAEGLPVSLNQFGWQVTFDRFTEHQGQELPSRMTAERDPIQVKLAISRWRGGEP